MTASSFSLARRLRAGETVHTGWCGLASPVVAELIAREGYPAVTLDQQHGMYDMPSTVAGIAAVRMGGAAPIVRIPVGSFAVASRVLDLGAEGIVAPMINTPDDARAFAAATKFPPIGERSWGPIRAATFLGMQPVDYLAQANDNVVTFAMIETRAALKNLDAILATPGIDAIFLGPSDMSITLSDGKVLDPHSKDVDKAADQMAAAAQKAGKIVGAYVATPERANELAERGFRFFAIASDLGFLRAGAAAALKALKR